MSCESIFRSEDFLAGFVDRIFGIGVGVCDTPHTECCQRIDFTSSESSTITTSLVELGTSDV